LIGGVIASSADPSKNLLDTGSLTYESIHNEANYSASNIGVSAGYSAGGGFSGSPMLGVPQSGHSSSDTNAGIAQGTIIQRDGNADLSGLDRHPTLDNQALNPVFDAQKVQENMELGNVAGQVGMRSAGTLAQYMANHATTPEEQAAWSDGGANKTLLHGLVGAATAALGGGNALQGALGAAASEAASGAMQHYLDDQGITDPSQRNLLMQLASTAIGGAVGGGAGAATALQGDQYNRQLHQTEKDRIKQLAGGDPNREADLSAAACALVKCSAEYAIGTPEYDYYCHLEALGNQPQYSDDRELLKQQTYTNYITMKDGGQVPVEQNLFTYSWTDKTSDAITWFDNSYGQPITRAGGLLQAVGGGAATVSGGSLAVGGGTTCLATGVSCLAAGGGVLLAGWGLDQTQAGLGTLWNGTPTSTVGGQLIQNAFGVSPGAAELMYGALGAVGSAAAGSSLALANTAADNNYNLLLKSGGVFAQDGTPLMNFNGLTKAQKGVVGEVLGGSYADNALGNAQRIGRVPGVGQNGIDDLLKVNRPDVDYVIVEYKFGSSSLKPTADGLQMSDGWLTGAKTGNDRILQSVGRIEGPQVEKALNAGRVEKWIVYTDPYGKVTMGILGPNGKLIPQQSSSLIGDLK
jgi:filamentous hemagglutinin